jgi:hypothetical protein
MQHVDDFGDEPKPVGRDVEPEIEGLDELCAHVLPWGGGEVGEGFEGCLLMDYMPRLGREGKRTRLFLLVGPYGGRRFEQSSQPPS